MPNTATETFNLVSDLQVSGNTRYNGNQWREAILAYLGGVWSGDESVTNRQKISFNNTVLRLGCDDKYYAYFVNEPDETQQMWSSLETLVVVDTTQNNVESGLIRFVRNNKIRQFALVFDNGVSSEGMILLTKGQKRSELHISTYGLMSMTIWMQRLGYTV
jgi:hypothetical protein